MGFVRNGVHKALEEAANEMIRASLEGVTKYSEKADILTPWKEQDRRNREVYTDAGVPDSSTRKGLFYRSINTERPDLNSRDGTVARAGRGRSKSIQAHVAEYGVNHFGDET
jgi:hypothetical protein